jgi:hypothetical protein
MLSASSAHVTTLVASTRSEMSTKRDHAAIQETRQGARLRRKGGVLLVGVVLAGVVVVTTAWTSTRTAAPVHLYWANNTPGWGAKPAATTIGRARLDGTGVEHSFVSGAGRRPCGVALDRKHIYWGELQGGEIGRPDEGGAIGRANRDGSRVNARFVPAPGMGACGVAIAGGHIYWANGGAIARANEDGTHVDLHFIPGLASAAGGTCGIATAGKYVYWGKWDEVTPQRTIGRAKLDGSDVDSRFITGVVNACGIAVARGHIYWTNYPAGVRSRQFRAAIGRANLDGTGVNQRFLRTASGPCGVAAYQDHIYWGESKGGFAHPSTTIGRAKLNGSAVNAEFITGIHDICFGLAVG